MVASEGADLAGVTIGDQATIGAGTLVNRDIPARTLAGAFPSSLSRAAANTSGVTALRKRMNS